MTLSEAEYLNPGAETELQAMFEGYLTVASTVPNLVFNFVTALLIKRWVFLTHEALETT